MFGTQAIHIRGKIITFVRQIDTADGFSRIHALLALHCAVVTAHMCLNKSGRCTAQWESLHRSPSFD